MELSIASNKQEFINHIHNDGIGIYIGVAKGKGGDIYENVLERAKIVHTFISMQYNLDRILDIMYFGEWDFEISKFEILQENSLLILDGSSSDKPLSLVDEDIRTAWEAFDNVLFIKNKQLVSWNTNYEDYQVVLDKDLVESKEILSEVLTDTPEGWDREIGEDLIDELTMSKNIFEIFGSSAVKVNSKQEISQPTNQAETSMGLLLLSRRRRV